MSEKRPGMSLSVHLSIIWGVTLAVLTLLEWRSLDREPLREPILLPYIERTVEMREGSNAAGDSFSGDLPEPGAQDEVLEVEFNFNGPLFLACFFGPILAIRGVGWLYGRVRQAGS